MNNVLIFRYQHVCHWAGFILVGKDTYVNINEIKHAHLDQLIDKCEAELEEESDTPILNPRAVVPNGEFKAFKKINIFRRKMHTVSLKDIYTYLY